MGTRSCVRAGVGRSSPGRRGTGKGKARRAFAHPRPLSARAGCAPSRAGAGAGRVVFSQTRAPSSPSTHPGSRRTSADRRGDVRPRLPFTRAARPDPGAPPARRPPDPRTPGAEQEGAAPAPPRPEPPRSPWPEWGDSKVPSHPPAPARTARPEKKLRAEPSDKSPRPPAHRPLRPRLLRRGPPTLGPTARATLPAVQTPRAADSAYPAGGLLGAERGVSGAGIPDSGTAPRTAPVPAFGGAAPPRDIRGSPGASRPLIGSGAEATSTWREHRAHPAALGAQEARAPLCTPHPPAHALAGAHAHTHIGVHSHRQSVQLTHSLPQS